MKKKKWEIAYEFYRKGMSKTDACKKAGCNLSTLSHSIKSHKLETLPEDEYRTSLKSKVDFRNMEIIRKAAERKVSVKKICEEEGLLSSNFYSWAKRKKIKINKLYIRGK